MNMPRFLLWLAGYLLAMPLAAQVPQLIHYQGRLISNGTNFTGTGQFKFALVGTNASGATVGFWNNDGSATAAFEPNAAVSLPVDNGLYSVLLGDATLAHMRIIPATVFVNPEVKLRIWFSPGAPTSFELLAPDQRIAAVGYAMMAATAATVADQAITSAKLADGAVTAAKLADQALTRNKIAAGQVVKSLNALKEDVVLAPGPSIALATNGNTLQIGVSGGGAWGLNGNGGTTPETQFIGTTDAKPLVFRADNQTGLRLEPTSGRFGRAATPNVIAGYSGNLASNGVVGAAIGGGGASAGNENTVGGDYAVAGGGLRNQASGSYATVPGGQNNTASGNHSFAAGRGAQARHNGAFVWSDAITGLGSGLSSGNSNQFLVRATGGVGINTANPTANLTVRHAGEFDRLMSFQNATGQEVASLDPSGNLATKNQPFVKYVQGGREDFHSYPNSYPDCESGSFTICEMDVDTPSAGVLLIRGHAELSGVAHKGSGACRFSVDPLFHYPETDIDGLRRTVSDLEKGLADLADIVSHLNLHKPSSLPEKSSLKMNAIEESPFMHFGIGLFRIEKGVEQALSYSGREYNPFVFRDYSDLRLEVSWVLPVSAGQRTSLRLSGRGMLHANFQVGAGVEKFNLTASFQPHVQN